MMFCIRTTFTDSLYVTDSKLTTDDSRPGLRQTASKIKPMAHTVDNNRLDKKIDRLPQPKWLTTHRADKNLLMLCR